VPGPPEPAGGDRGADGAHDAGPHDVLCAPEPTGGDSGAYRAHDVGSRRVLHALEPTGGDWGANRSHDDGPSSCRALQSLPEGIGGLTGALKAGAV
jgi:hypothetical protein